MLTSLQGIFRKGRIELPKKPRNIPENTPVIVTFLEHGGKNLRAHGISKTQAKALRAQLAAFEAEWESPEMSDYDNYDTSRSRIQAR